MNVRFLGAIGALMLAGTFVQAVGADAPLPSATDLWNEPVTVDYLVPGGGFPVLPVEDMFNGVASVSFGGGSILANGKPPGTVHAVEWTLAEPVTVKSLNLFLAHDGRGVSDPSFKLRDARARGITKFELLADTGSGFQTVLTADVQMADGGDTGPQPPGEPVCPSPQCFNLYDPVYSGASLSGQGTSFVTLNTVAGYLTIAADFPATTSDKWRAEFTQFGNFLDLYSDTGGSRILELDGLADPQFPLCTLDVILSYGGGNLNMDFEVGSATPTNWNVLLSVFDRTIRLWSIPIPAIDPPLEVPVNVPFPSLGGVGVLTTLTISNEGIICSDWQTVDTGPVSPSQATDPDTLQGIISGR